MSKYVVRVQTHSVFDLVIANPFENVFAYEDVDSSGSAEDLAEAWQSNIETPMKSILCGNIVFDQIYVYSLDDLGDFWIQPAGGNGARAGEMLPNTNGWAYRYVRTTREINDGRKTFAGIAEPDQANGGATASMLTILETFAGVLEATLTGAGADYLPRIWRRAGDYGDPPTAFGDTFYAIAGVEYVRISTQNTRKR